MRKKVVCILTLIVMLIFTSVVAYASGITVTPSSYIFDDDVDLIYYGATSTDIDADQFIQGQVFHLGVLVGTVNGQGYGTFVDTMHTFDFAPCGHVWEETTTHRGSYSGGNTFYATTSDSTLW